MIVTVNASLRFITISKMLIGCIIDFCGGLSLTPSHKFRSSFKCQVIIIPKYFCDYGRIILSKDFFIPLFCMLFCITGLPERVSIISHIKKELQVVFQWLYIAYV